MSPNQPKYIIRLIYSQIRIFKKILINPLNLMCNHLITYLDT